MNTETSLWILLGLGAMHGLNPAMGWLFAVSLGLQENRRRAVWRALAPLAVGHGLAIGSAAAVAVMLGVVIPLGVLKWAVGGALVGVGVFRLLRHRHPRLRGMRVRARELVLWSFLMASAHGAGLMALPFFLEPGPTAAPAAIHDAAAHAHVGHDPPTSQAGLTDPQLPEAGATRDAGRYAALATGVHTTGYLLIAVLAAVLVYELAGLRVLRRAWINIDLVWAAALIVTGLLTPLV
ncbi:MAG TPA: hypothetical protein VF167_07195 [Longimicrobiaceae bacterium]